MLAFVFPGQGSQKRGMGQELFDSVAEFKESEREIDSILGYSLRQLCTLDADNRLKETQFTQPCLYVVNALHYYSARSRGETADFFAGHSLGEYNALLAAGAFDFLTGLKLVQKRGELMSQAKGGGMAAVIGLPAVRVAALVADNGFSTVDIANYNSSTQTVISGDADEIKRAAPVFEKAGAQMFVPLQVSAAFHSRHVAPAAAAFGEFLANFRFEPLQRTVICNVTGLPYPSQNPTTSIATMLTKQITHSVMWVQGIRYLLGRGVKEFKEMGPGNVLSRLVQQIRQESARAA